MSRPRRRRRPRDDPRTGRLVDGRACPELADGHRLRLPARRRPTRRCPTRARGGSRTGVHGPQPALRPGRARLDATSGWTGRQLAGQRHLRAARRHLHPGGHPRRRDRPARPPGRPRRRLRRAAAGQRLQRRRTTGATTGCCWYAVHEPYGGPTAYQRFVDACHAARPRGHPRRRLQPPRPVGATTSPMFGPYLTDAAQHLGPHRSTWTAPDSDEVRRLHPRQRR